MPDPLLPVPKSQAYLTMVRGGATLEPAPLNTMSSPMPGELGENTKLAVGTPEVPTGTVFEREPLRPAMSVTVSVTA